MELKIFNQAEPVKAEPTYLKLQDVGLGGITVVVVDAQGRQTGRLLTVRTDGRVRLHSNSGKIAGFKNSGDYRQQVALA